MCCDILKFVKKRKKNPLGRALKKGGGWSRWLRVPKSVCIFRVRGWGKHMVKGREELSLRRPEATRGIVSRSQLTRVEGGQKPCFHLQEMSVCKGI